MAEEFNTDSSVSSYHVYQDNWAAVRSWRATSLWQYYLIADLMDHKGQETVDHCDISQP